MKIKNLLLAGLACAVMVPATGVLAEDTTATAPGNQTVQLTANKASSYTVTLPKTVDISNVETTFNVKVKGDINGNETIRVTMSDTKLTETVAAGGTAHADIPVTVEFGTGKAQTFKHDAISGEGATEVATLNHAAIQAGTWTGSLPVVIAVDTAK